MKRSEFKRFVVENAILQNGEYGGFGNGNEARWFEDLLKDKPFTWQETPRSVNDFLVGADPEFAFYDGENYRSADGIGLYPGLAFGADQNGRLGELRVEPSRCVLDLVAGTAKTLQWLKLYMNQIGWQAYCPPVVVFSGHGRHDGIGGHVHFGRKSSPNQRSEEIKQLDEMFRLFVRSGIWDQRGCDNRRNGTSYGRFTDTREQLHGFEYRSFPSWLQSPWMSYLTLTLAKLTVHDPSLARWERIESNAQGFIDLFLSYYAGLDDDARLARRILRLVGLPRAQVKDFFPEWGIKKVNETMQEALGKIEVWPTVFKVTDGDRKWVFDKFYKGEVFEAPKVQIDWEPTRVPREFVLSTEMVNPFRINGIGDLICGTVMWKKMVFMMVGDANMGNEVRISSLLAEKLADGWAEEVRKLGIEAGTYPDIKMCMHIGAIVRKSPRQLAKFRKLLLGGLFPIWKVGEASKEKLKKWEVSDAGIKGIKVLEI